MVSEMADIMNHCRIKANSIKERRVNTDDFKEKNRLAAAESVYEEVYRMCRFALIEGGYLDPEDDES